MLANAFSVGNVYWFDPGLSQSSNAWAEIRKRLRRRSLRDQFPDLPPVTAQGCRKAPTPGLRFAKAFGVDHFAISIPTSRQVMSLMLFSASTLRKASLVKTSKSRWSPAAPQFAR